ncbi:odorant receptor 4-like [Apis dorsata]|uniref:odorant receptor 4-like n=1 Tax=Apis dorsata TaxID=7462 RepID=UPI0003DF64D5|nr:odorant receptor 4-like [Apis dorsata]
MDFAMGWNRFNLTLLGVYPEPRKMSRNSRLMSNLIFWFTTLVTFTFICAPQTANLILKSTSLDEVIENLSINIPIVFALIKQIVLRYYKKALTQLLGEMLADWSEPIGDQDRETMLRNARIGRAISIVCSTLTYFMLFAFVSLQIWSNAENASEADLGGLLHPATFPYETSRSPNFEITWLGQLMGTVLTAICYSCFDTFLAVLVLHLCGQLTVLGTALEDLVNATRRNDYKTFEERLRSIVNRHNHLSRFAVIVEDCFNITLLVQTLICTAMFCLTGYRMITSVDREEADVPIVGMIFFIIHVIYTMLHLFIYCYVGETLLGQSTGIGRSTYDCNWYDLPSRHAVLLVIVIRRANVSFQITAGKFSPFSLELFNAVLKTSAGYLSVLLAMKDRPVEEK